MGRWTQYDEDEYRLPEGFRRVGYDADSGCHFFKDADGTLWKGPEGAEYGELTKCTDQSQWAMDGSPENEDLESQSTRGGRKDGYTPLPTELAIMSSTDSSLTHTSPYRYILPFFLIICVILLLAWRLFLQPTTHVTPTCAPQSYPYRIRTGDTCWDIAHSHKVSLRNLSAPEGESLNCDNLQLGHTICISGL